MSKLLTTLLKISISVAIITWLVWDAVCDDAFGLLWAQPKHWGLLLAACALCCVAAMLTFVRWCYLVRALDMPFALKDAFRLGFLGYMFNMAPLGIVGGDLLKGWMLAKEQTDHRTEAMATVVVDRIIGLYALFVVSSIAIVITQFWQYGTDISYVCKATIALTAIGTLGLLALFTPGVTNGKVTSALASIPKIGPTIERLLGAVRMYQQKKRVLAASMAMSFGVHSLFTLGIFLLAYGLYNAIPSLGLHFVIAPLSAVTQVIPLPAGPMEAGLEFLYRSVGMLEHQGFIVALGYRIISILVAIVGVCYFLANRQKVSEVLHDTEASERLSSGQTAINNNSFCSKPHIALHDYSSTPQAK